MELHVENSVLQEINNEIRLNSETKLFAILCNFANSKELIYKAKTFKCMYSQLNENDSFKEFIKLNSSELLKAIVSDWDT